MKTVIKLTEAELKRAVHEYVENNTKFLDEDNAQEITISRDAASGEWNAEVSFDKDVAPDA